MNVSRELIRWLASVQRQTFREDLGFRNRGTPPRKHFVRRNTDRSLAGRLIRRAFG